MASRRTENRIRGPHSALTDFLAANNISARQIRDDYERRQREAAQQDGDDEDNEEVDIDEAEAAIARNRKRRRQEEAISKAKLDRKMKNTKKAASKKKKGKRRGGDSDDDDDDSDFDLGQEMYAKAKKLPGQFANCEICEKRFTVTPYSKTGPDSGLLCSPCGRELDKDAKKSDKSVAPRVSAATKRRRQAESERLNGVVRRGAKPLVQHCIETVLKYHNEIESFENMPEHLIFQVRQLFSKHRVLDSVSLPLFFRADIDQLHVFDCANLKTEDYSRIFAELPRLKSLVLESAYQFKDTNIDYMIDKARNLKDLRIYAANLVSSEKWSDLFRARGFTLETIKLKWLDAAFTDKQVADLVKYCPNVTRLKLEYCWLIGPESIDSIANMEKLQHLSLHFMIPIPNENLIDLINAVGPQLQTLSLRGFKDLDDEVLQTIHNSCHQLKKFRILENDLTSDAGWAALFTDWANPPLEFVDLSAVRDVDNQKPDGPEDGAVGLAAEGFAALMAHSGEAIRHLNIMSCRHIPLQTLMDVFQLGASFPKLENVDFSFVQHVDDVVLAGLFKASKGTLKKVALFGCFAITSDCMVPRGVVVIGAPRIGIEEEGMEIWGSTEMITDPDDIQKVLDAQLDAEMASD